MQVGIWAVASTNACRLIPSLFPKYENHVGALVAEDMKVFAGDRQEVPSVRADSRVLDFLRQVG